MKIDDKIFGMKDKFKASKNPKLTLFETFVKWELERHGLKPERLVPTPYDGRGWIPDFVCNDKYIEAKRRVNKQFLNVVSKVLVKVQHTYWQ